MIMLFKEFSQKLPNTQIQNTFFKRYFVQNKCVAPSTISKKILPKYNSLSKG